MNKANTDTTYCINTECKKCWRHISNWQFDTDKNYCFTSGIDNCEGEENKQLESNKQTQ